MFRCRSSELVVLPITVTDTSGHLITDVPRESFPVYDEGRLQQTSAFDNEDTPVSIALVIDNSGSMGQKLGEVMAASLAFAKWSHPEDELFAFSSTTMCGTHSMAGASPPQTCPSSSARFAAWDGITTEGSGDHRKSIVAVTSDGDSATSVVDFRPVTLSVPSG